MNTRICPFNQQPCGCDPNAEKNQRARASVVSAPPSSFACSVLRSKVNDCQRCSGSEEFLQNEGLTFSDLGDTVQDKQYTIAEARLIYEQGKQKGLVEEARKQQETEFFDIDGQPQWYEIAVFCQQNSSKLRDEWERSFVSDMPSKIIKFGRPTEKQAPHLLAIFVKLGGRYDPKTAHVRR